MRPSFVRIWSNNASIDDRDERVLHGLGHLLARAAFDERQLAEDLAGYAVRQRELLAIAGDLADPEAATVHEIHGIAGSPGR